MLYQIKSKVAGMAEDSSIGLKFQVLPISGFSAWPPVYKINILLMILFIDFEIAKRPAT